MHEFDNELSDALRRELRRLPQLGAPARSRVMVAVRHAAMLTSRAGWLSPLIAATVAAGLALGVLGTNLARDGRHAGGPLAPVVGAAFTVAIRDTLLFVRFAFSAPHAERVALVGDFNGWHTDSTPLVRGAGGGAWSAQVAMARGDHRYAFVVDDTGWVVDPSAPAAHAPNGRPASRFVAPSLQ